MTENPHRLDRFVRRATDARVDARAEQHSRQAFEAAKGALLEGIVGMSTSVPEFREKELATRPPGPEGPRRSGKRSGRRRTTAIVAAVVAAGASTAAAAVVAIGGGSPATTTAVQCAYPDGNSTVVNSTTGDPVVDCAAQWRLEGKEPPPLTAYDNGAGGVTVLPDSEPVPSGWVALGPGFAQDGRLIELEASLSDYIEGFTSRCFDDAAARSFATGELVRLGLTGWTVTSRTPQGELADGTTVCAYGRPYPEQRTVELGNIPAANARMGFDDFPEEFLDRIRTSFANCLNLADAAAAVRAVGVEVGYSEQDFRLDQVPDPATACTRVDVNIGGTISVVLRGPGAAT